jgi:hypothetical protein
MKISYGQSIGEWKYESVEWQLLVAKIMQAELPSCCLDPQNTDKFFMKARNQHEQICFQKKNFLCSYKQ